MLRIASQTLEEAERYCMQAYPREACGVFHGVPLDGLWIVTDWSPVVNISVQPDRHFSFHPEQWIRLLYEESTSRRLVGTFHSHPAGKALPSSADLSGIRSLPSVWIVSLRNFSRPEWQVFRREGGAEWEQAVWTLDDE